MKDTITVYYNGGGMTVDGEVARLNGIKDNYCIPSEGEFWQILELNATHSLARIKMIQQSIKSTN